MRKMFEEWFVKMLTRAVYNALRNEKLIEKAVNEDNEFIMGLITREEAEQKYNN